MHKHYIALLMILLLTITVFVTKAFTNSIEQHVQLQLTTPKAVFKTGEHVVLDYTLTNTSRSSIRISPEDHGIECCDIVKGDGTTPKSLFVGDASSLGGEALTDAGLLILMKPGDTYKDSIAELDGLYDLSAPGTYLIRATWEYEIGEKEQMATSNLIRITVAK